MSSCNTGKRRARAHALTHTQRRDLLTNVGLDNDADLWFSGFLLFAWAVYLRRENDQLDFLEYIWLVFVDVSRAKAAFVVGCVFGRVIDWLVHFTAVLDFITVFLTLNSYFLSCALMHVVLTPARQKEIHPVCYTVKGVPGRCHEYRVRLRCS